MARLERNHPDPRVPDVPLAFVDTETTGTRCPWVKDGRRPWEVGVVVRYPDGRRSEFAAYLANVDLTGADPGSLEISGFATRHPQHNRVGGLGVDPRTRLMPQAEVAHRLYDLLAGTQIVALNVAFDVTNFEWLLAQHGLGGTEPWDYHHFDLGAATAQVFGWQSPYSGSALARACGVFPENFGRGVAHSALDDALWHEGWYDRLHTYPTQGLGLGLRQAAWRFRASRRPALPDAA